MTPQIRQKAATLLIELESLRECKTEGNSIGTYALLGEILKDATSLATQTIEGMRAAPTLSDESLDSRCKAARLACDLAVISSKRASLRLKNAIERSNKAIKRSGKLNGDFFERRVA